MAPTRTEVVKNEEKVKPNLKKSLKIPKFEEMEIDSTETSKNNVVILKNTMKRKNEDSGNDGSEAKKMDWIKEKAKDAVIPDEKKAVLKSKFLFKESGPLIIHLCNQCKEFNGNRDTQTVSQGMVQLPLAMCSVCRFHLNQARNLRFFQHELPSLKKQYQL